MFNQGSGKNRIHQVENLPLYLVNLLVVVGSLVLSERALL